ncbi:TPA: DNA cytosine methyltransferase [Salmonella enterica subsp. salamae serovar 35:g,m,s,t:-]|nr:DNA cytosine methyltransferase [Salmonella enterica subsp. salamae serovar 35:g,m,s,t:-]HCA3549733.1 DNA cytosine methyltransferase [Salmonella enterica subsp. salamae serovar 35:g,m,s,t:-]
MATLGTLSAGALFVDNFAGGGGTSTGIEMAIGRAVDIAINHDMHAVAMHTINHPGTQHYCENVFDINPVMATGGRPVALAWFSPDCTHFSRAKGSKPVKREIRGLAWIVLRWALAVRPQVMMLENVMEFPTWGPLLTDANGDLFPDPSRIGETFQAFLGILTTGISPEHPALAEACEFLDIDPASTQAKWLANGLGYKVEYKVLKAYEFGAPTVRKRFFMIMRSDGRAIQWPAPTHGDPKSADVRSGKLLPWLRAADCIDWSIPCHSIFGRKRPLAENTQKRIARGLQKFVINDPEPFIIKCNHSAAGYDAFRGQSLFEPLHTVTGRNGYAIVTPHLTKFRGDATGSNITDPVPTITAGTSVRPGGNGHALGLVEAMAVPFIAGNGGSAYQAKPRAVNVPMHTIMKESRACVITPVIARQFGRSTGHKIDEPLATITAGGSGKCQLITPTLIEIGYGEREGQAPRAPGLDRPLGTVVSGGMKHALVAAHLTKHFGGNDQGSGVAMFDPLDTITTKDHHSLVASHMVKLRRTGDCQSVKTPMPTITAGGLHVGEVRTQLEVMTNDTEFPMEDAVVEFLHQYCGEDCSNVVEIDGEYYRIVDIGMRMLQPHELFKAQGFPENYVIDRDVNGNKYPKNKQVARCGNAVPPQFAEALVRANLPEYCSQVNTEAA